MITRLHRALFQIQRELDRLDVPWALVGGLAIGFRGAPRFTQDVDLAVAVRGPRADERLVFELRQEGFEIAGDLHFEQEAAERLSIVPLRHAEDEIGIRLDLLFGSSGIEPEIVEAAEPLEVEPGHVVPVATVGHLLALKVLAGRDQDRWDVRRLLSVASSDDIAQAQRALELIDRRGYDRGQNLYARFGELLDLGAEPV